MTSGYAYNIHSIRLSRNDSIRVTANIAVFALVYTIAGALMSFVLYYLFDMYDPEKKEGLEWEKKGIAFQLFDIIVELSIISTMAFWLVYILNVSTPIIPVRKGLEDFVDSYTSGMFFMFAVFIFLTDLTSKLKYVFKVALGDIFDMVFPEEGSILDMSLRYSAKQRKKMSACFGRKYNA